MKKLFTEITTITIITIIIMYTFISFTMKVSAPSYQRDMVIVATEFDNNGERLITLEDINGYTWDYYSDDYKIGDTFVVYFDDNGTSETIFDDEIRTIELLCNAQYGVN